MTRGPRKCGPLARSIGALLFAGMCAWGALLCAASAHAAENDPQSKPAITLDEALATGDLSEERAAAFRETFAEATPEQLVALEYLLHYMPQHDLENLDPAILAENIEYACRVRDEAPWADQLTGELFYNYVLPYASLNEERDAWRKDFYDRFFERVQECATPGEAAVLLNKEVFPELEVRYHATRREKPDQCPSESIEQGYASCTGLSIMLVDACRACGVPARVAGIPSWDGGPGNHTWTEVWDGHSWRFTGSAEPANDLDIAWFSGRAAGANNENPATTIYASSYALTDRPFPLVWDLNIEYVSAHDVTGFYTNRQNVAFQPGEDLPEGARLAVFQGNQLVAAGDLTEPFEAYLAGDSDYLASIVDAEGNTLSEISFTLAAENAALEVTADSIAPPQE